MTQQLCDVVTAATRRKPGAFTPLPQVPPIGAQIFEWFWEVERTRQAGAHGPQSLTYQELWCWCQLARVELLAWELAAIIAMSEARMRAMMAEPDPITPELFDLMFK